MSYALGIDLGTTYTAAAAARDGRAEVAALGYRATSVPTVVFLTDEGRFLVGDAAERRATTAPDRVAREFKRRVGDPTPLFLGGTPVAVDRCLAEVMAWVATTVGQAEGGPAAAVTVTHPANWGEFKRDILREALRLAELPHAQMLVEPVAAAAWYAQAERLAPGATVAVYDLGGGTFDAAVVRCLPDGGFGLLGRAEGVERLGGIDVDQAVLAHVVRAAGLSESDLDGSGGGDGHGDGHDPGAAAALAQLRRSCVEAKEALSAETSVTVPVLLPGRHHEVLLRRTELEEMVGPLLAPTVDAVRRVVSGAGLRPEDLDAVLLVGGSSRMPLTARQVSAGLGRPVAVDAHPKHPVALGAALDAGARMAAAAGAPAPPPATVAAVAPPGWSAPAAGPMHWPGASPGNGNPARPGVPGIGAQPFSGPGYGAAQGNTVPSPAYGPASNRGPTSAGPLADAGGPPRLAGPGYPPPVRPAGRAAWIGAVLSIAAGLIVVVVMAVLVNRRLERDRDDDGTTLSDETPGVTAEGDVQGEDADEPETAAGAPALSFVNQMGEETSGDVVAVDESRVYVLDSRANLRAFDLASGAEAWWKDLGDEASGRPVRAGNLVIASATEPESVTVAFDAATGAEAWRADGYWFDAPVVVGDLVIEHSAGTITALDMASGEVRWEREIEHWAWADLVVMGEAVVTASDDGWVTAVNAADGRVLWDQQVERGKVTIWVLTSLGDGVAAADGDGFVSVFNADGTPRWTREMTANYFEPPVAVGGVLAVAVEDGLDLVDPASGDRVRSLAEHAGIMALAPGDTPGLVLLGVQLHAVDLEGHELWAVEMPMDFGEVVTFGATLVMTNSDGGVAVFAFPG